MTSPPSVRTVALGPTNSGKTTFLKRWFLPRCPRIIFLETTGETRRWNMHPSPRIVFSMGELHRALAALATVREWSIIIPASRVDMPMLLTWLIGGDDSADGNYLWDGYAQAIGGVTLWISEVENIAPNYAPINVTAAWKRGRHAGLSIVADGQRAADVSRSVTSQSEWRLFWSTDEPIDLDRIRKTLLPPAWAAFQTLQHHECLAWYRPSRQFWRVLNDVWTPLHIDGCDPNDDS